MRLSDKQWGKIEDLIPVGPRRPDGRGRPWRDNREVLEGILWVVKTGARWRDLPKEYPPYQTCHRRFGQWTQSGVFDHIIEALVRDLHERGGVDMSECFIDGTFSLAKKGGFWWERLNAVKAQGSWQSQTLVVLYYLSQSTQPHPMKSL
jgi:transposase